MSICHGRSLNHRCNIRCEHCMASCDLPAGRTMGHDKAKEIIAVMARAGVGGISFSAGEPFLYYNQIAELVELCRKLFNPSETSARLRCEVCLLAAWGPQCCRTFSGRYKQHVCALPGPVVAG